MLAFGRPMHCSEGVENSAGHSADSRGRAASAPSPNATSASQKVQRAFRLLRAIHEHREDIVKMRANGKWLQVWDLA